MSVTIRGAGGMKTSARLPAKRRLVADIDAALEQQVLDLAQR